MVSSESEVSWSSVIGRKESVLPQSPCNQSPQTTEWNAGCCEVWFKNKKTNPRGALRPAPVLETSLRTERKSAGCSSFKHMLVETQKWCLIWTRLDGMNLSSAPQTLAGVSVVYTAAPAASSKAHCASESAAQQLRSHNPLREAEPEKSEGRDHPPKRAVHVWTWPNDTDRDRMFCCLNAIEGAGSTHTHTPLTATVCPACNADPWWPKAKTQSWCNTEQCSPPSLLPVGIDRTNLSDKSKTSI